MASRWAVDSPRTSVRLCSDCHRCRTHQTLAPSRDTIPRRNYSRPLWVEPTRLLQSGFCPLRYSTAQICVWSQQLIRRYRRFFAEPVSPWPMGAFRALFGALVVLNAFFLYPDLEIWFSEAGVLPSVLAKKAFGTIRFSVFWWLGSSLPMVKAVFTIHLIASPADYRGAFGSQWTGS